MYRKQLVEGVDYSVFVKSIPMGRFGAAAEVADTALWLLSARSSHVTGQALVVDGGMTITSVGSPG